MNIFFIGVEEGHGLIKQFVKSHMRLYLKISSSLHVKIDINRCVAYMHMTNKMVSQIKKKYFSVEDPYRKIIQ